METQKQALELVKYILEQICTEKESIILEPSEDDLGLLISIRVAEADMGRLIGKEGQNISAIRTLVRIIGAREQSRINLKVLEPTDAPSE